MSNSLKLTVGSSRDFNVYLLDDMDQAEDLADAVDATLSIKEYVGASTNILYRSIGDANLSIDDVNGRLVATLTQIEADALIAGSYIAEAAIQMTASSKWFHTVPFIVEVFNQGTDHG